MKSRRILVTAAAAMLTLSACATSDPPTNELAEEVVDSLDVSQDVKDCMYDVIEGFELNDDEVTVAEDLGEAADKADEGNELALEIMARFESQLSACN